MLPDNAAEDTTGPGSASCVPQPEWW
jgi:hypothetical protein